MNANRFLTQRYFIIGGVVILLGLISFAAWNAITLRIVSMSPDINSVSNVEPFIDFRLNHAVEKAESVKLNDIDTSYEIVDNATLRVKLTNLNANATNTLTIGVIIAKNTKRLENLSYTFTTEYKDFNQLSEEAQKENVEQSDSGQSTDPFFTSNTFPIERDGYVIRDKTVEYEYPVLGVTFDEEIAPSPDADRPQVSNAKALALQKDLLDFIRSQGGNPDTYYISYSNQYLNSLNPVGD